MSDLANSKPRPSQYIENGHNSALRDGSSFGFVGSGIVLASSASISIRFTTGTFAIVFEAGRFTLDQENVLYEVYEDTTFSSPGSVNTAYIRKHNRLSLRESQIVTYDGAVVDSIGTQILNDRIRGVAAQGQNKPGFGSGGETDEIVLKPNTEHMFKITNDSLATVNTDVHFFFREVDPKQYNVTA